MIERLNPRIAENIREKGMRNGCLTTIAPTGTISLLAGNVSSGIEPVFDFVYSRRVREADGGLRTESVEDFAHAMFRSRSREAGELPGEFVRASDIGPTDHLRMQAAVQRYCDSSISKTINVPEDFAYDDFEDVYRQAYELGLKGCTTFRLSPVRGAVLVPDKTTIQSSGEAAPSSAPSPAPASPVSSDHNLPPAPLPTAPAGGDHAGDVVYLSKPLERSPVLHGMTYKLKWPGSDHALYVTINDTERDGRRRPFEIFINTKSLEHYAWTVALTRMISAVFRRGGDVTFVAEELQAIFDPQGGRWVSGRYVPSLQAAIGEIIEGHMQRIGFLQEGAGQRAPPAIAKADGLNEGAGIITDRSSPLPPEVTRPTGDRHRQCPRCGAIGYVRREGCWTCERCGFSQCD